MGEWYRDAEGMLRDRDAPPPPTPQVQKPPLGSAPMGKGPLEMAGGGMSTIAPKSPLGGLGGLADKFPGGGGTSWQGMDETVGPVETGGSYLGEAAGGQQPISGALDAGGSSAMAPPPRSYYGEQGGGWGTKPMPMGQPGPMGGGGMGQAMGQGMPQRPQPY